VITLNLKRIAELLDHLLRLELLEGHAVFVCEQTIGKLISSQSPPDFVLGQAGQLGFQRFSLLQLVDDAKHSI
jgi:hypothetical protein